MERRRNSGESTRASSFPADGDSLLSMHRQAFEEYSAENYEAALETLKRMEERLEMYTTQGSPVDQDLVLCTLNNIACCYQKLANSLKDLSWEIKAAKYQCIAHVQLCALLSQLGNHSDALSKAKQSVRLACFGLEATIHAYGLQSAKFLSYKRKKAPVPDSVMQNHVLAQRAYPALRSLEQFFDTGDIVLEEDPQMRSVLGVKTFGDWVYLLSISDMMVLQPLRLEDVKEKPQIRAEFAKDYMLHKVAHLAVAYFCVSTELKFLRGKQAFNPERDKDG